MVQDNSKILRKQYLEKRLEERIFKVDKPKIKKLQAILSADYTTKLWPKLRRYAKGEIRTSLLNRLEKPIYDETGEILEFQTIMDSEEIFSHLIQRNLIHFAQASQAPFVEGQCGQFFSPFQFNDFSKSILNGTVDLTHLDLNQASKACIREIANPRPNEMGTSPVLVNITIEDYKSGV